MTFPINPADVARLYETDPRFTAYVGKYLNLRQGADDRRCPSLSNLKLVRATFFDNGPPAKKTAGRSRLQFGISFEGWTELADINMSSPDWSLNVGLHDGATLTRLIETQLKNGSISEGYFNSLNAAVAEFPTLHFGQFFHNAGGQSYFDHQFCMVEIERGQPNFSGIINGALANMLSPSSDDGWSDTYTNGKRLGGNAVAQLRWDITGEFSEDAPKWATVKGAV